MFDPFGDFDKVGYLRNFFGEKNLEIIKIAEHQLFRAQLTQAQQFLAQQPRIGYCDFLEVHRLLFGGLYPWAGKDRNEVLPQSAVTKGDVYFCHPRDCQRAVEAGLVMAQDKKQMAARPGFIMGMFAYGHPFLDGNGRTMLLVHAELCFRANMAVDWLRTRKQPYLEALTQEIKDPQAGHLDAYLKPFIAPALSPEDWMQTITNMVGLDGSRSLEDATAPYADLGTALAYQEFERLRGPSKT